MSASGGRKGLWTSLLLIGACAACCAIPLLGALGLGAVTSAALAAFVDPEREILWIAGASAVLLMLVIVLVRARARRAACKTECASDRSCCG